MGVTLLGLVLIVMSLRWIADPLRLLQLAIVCSIFEAAAAMVIGGTMGLQPAMVPALLFVTYVALQYCLGMRYPGEGQVIWTMMPLLGLVAYALFSIFVLPQAFEGKIMVWPQRPDLIDPGYVPLAFTSGNVTQSMYLLFDVVVATCAALVATRPSVPYRSLLRAYLLGGYIAVGFAFWDFGSRTVGLPFPDSIIRSNPGWQIVRQVIGSVPRIQGTFSEPAGLAFYLSGLVFCCLWLKAQGYQVMRINLLLSLAILAMLCSTSTTGLLTLALGVPLLTVLSALRKDRAATKRLIRTIIGILVVGCVTIGPAFILKPSLRTDLHQVYIATISKTHSNSYDQRSGLDAGAMAAMIHTGGLGVGWGSYRASSLVPDILANGGIFGLLMVIWGTWRIGVIVRRSRAQAPDHTGIVVVRGFVAAVCGQLAAALLSSPTIGSVAFFLELGCLIGVAVRIGMETERAPPLARLGCAGIGSIYPQHRRMCDALESGSARGRDPGRPS